MEWLKAIVGNKSEYFANPLSFRLRWIFLESGMDQKDSCRRKPSSAHGNPVVHDPNLS